MKKMNIRTVRLTVPPRYSGLEDQDGKPVDMEWLNAVLDHWRQSREALHGLAVAYRKATGLDSAYDEDIRCAEALLDWGKDLD